MRPGTRAAARRGLIATQWPAGAGLLDSGPMRIPSRPRRRAIAGAPGAAVLAALLSACAHNTMTAPAPTAQAAIRHELEAFPRQLAGHVRHVIELPALPDEEDHKLELIGGRAMTVDCNTRGLDGGFQARDVPGWGYGYWVLQSRGQMRSTLMMCPPGSEKPGFVAAEPALVRYNSKLPVVVFVPEGYALRWRVWRAGATQEAPLR